jgi:hypothetical protein
MFYRVYNDTCSTLQVDVYGHRRLTRVLEWMGKHSLSIFVLVSSNLAVIAIQGFYWTKPENNIVRYCTVAVLCFHSAPNKQFTILVLVYFSSL